MTSKGFQTAESSRRKFSLGACSEDGILAESSLPLLLILLVSFGLNFFDFWLVGLVVSGVDEG